MTRCIGFILALALTACTCTAARADHSVTWGENQPAATQSNMMSASGNYHAEAGWEIAIVWLQVVPSPSASVLAHKPVTSPFLPAGGVEINGRNKMFLTLACRNLSRHTLRLLPSASRIMMGQGRSHRSTD